MQAIINRFFIKAERIVKIVLDLKSNNTNSFGSVNTMPAGFYIPGYLQVYLKYYKLLKKYCFYLIHFAIGCK